MTMLRRAFNRVNEFFNKKEWRRAKKKYKKLTWPQKTGASALFDDRQVKIGKEKSL